MPLTIAVVDDSDVDRYLIKRISNQLASEVTFVEFAAGDQFLETIIDEQRRTEELGESPPPALILLDINMPRMNGHEVLQALQNQLGDNYSFMSVVMYSSSAFIEDKMSALKYPFVKDYIVKPISKSQLQSAIDSYCLTN